MSGSDRTKSWTSLVTIPNLLGLLRMVGSPLILLFAVAGHELWFFGIFLVLMFTDWLDGKLAILLNQRSAFGARLDSAADFLMYGSLLLGGVWLKWDFLLAEIAWIVPAFAGYVFSLATCWIKFRRTPSYHTRAAKTCWLLIGIAVLFIAADGSRWPFRLAMLALTLTNLETGTITLVLDQWQSDVPSLYHAVRSKRRSECTNPQTPGSEKCAER